MKGISVCSVFGTGFRNNRGKVNNKIKIMSGYTDRGRTNVLPPATPGMYGKLVTGRNIKNAAQETANTI